MIFWLLNLSDSKTSTLCLCLGCFVIAAAHSNFGQRHIGSLKTLAPIIFVLYLILTLGLGMGAQLSQSVGRSGNMSDRTRIWQVLLSVPINHVLGTGYQSFWLGPRVQWVWARLTGDNVLEAHNGYLETYLELGLVGFFFLCVFLIATYRNICKRLKPLTPIGSLGLGLWSLLLFYNITEAAFEPGFLFITFLIGSLTVAQRAEIEVHAAAPMTPDGTDQATNTAFAEYAS
jgi:O-antigen ligase